MYFLPLPQGHGSFGHTFLWSNIVDGLAAARSITSTPSVCGVFQDKLIRALGMGFASISSTGCSNSSSLVSTCPKSISPPSP